MSPTSSSPSRIRSRPVSVTSPICVARTSQRSHTVEQLGQPLRLHHAQHPLLRLGDHDLEGLHVVLAQRHARHVDVEAHPALRGHLRRAERTVPPRPGPAGPRAASRSSSSRQHSSRLASPRTGRRSAPWAAWTRPPRRARRWPARTHRRCRRARCARPSAPAGCPGTGGRAADQPVAPGQARRTWRSRGSSARSSARRATSPPTVGHADRVPVVPDALHRPSRTGTGSAGSRAPRSEASRGSRSAARRSRRRHGGSRPRPWPLPGRAPPRSGGCATPP